MTHHLPHRRGSRFWDVLARYPLPMAVLVVALVGLGVVLALRADPKPEVSVAAPATSRPTVTHDPSVPVPSSSTTASSTPATVAPESISPPVTAFGDGRFYVSTAGSSGAAGSVEDVTVAPGTYRSARLAAGEVCSWERRDGSDGVRDRSRGPVTVELRPGNFFRSQGCGAWLRLR